MGRWIQAGSWLWAISLLLAALAWAEPVTIGGVTYDSVDPGEPFTAAPIPEQNWPMPSPTKEEKAAGVIMFVAPDPGEYRPYRRPKAEEHVTSLKVFLTPGEAEPLCFGVRTLTALRGVRIRVSIAPAPLSVDIRHMHCWPQRTGWRSRQYYITPELLLPCAEGRKMIPHRRGVLREVAFDLEAEQTQGFWITLRAEPNARPGLYSGVVRFESAEKPPLSVPLQVEIMPFRLERPSDRAWLLYADAFLWRNMSDAQVLALLKDFAAHGMNGLVEFPFGRPDLSRLKEGIVTYDASPYRKYVALCQQAGLNGPFVIGSQGAWQVKEVLGLNVDLNKDVWPTELKQGVKLIAKAALEATQGLPRWYYYGVDEPSGDNTYAIQDYESWHAGGAPTYATFYMPQFLEKAAAYLTAPCFVVGLVSAEKTARFAREMCEKYGAEFWYYGTGSYVNPFPQEGFMFHNRYGAGLLFWKTGAKCEVSWTFCRPHEDVFNDFDGSRANAAEPKEQATAYPHLLKEDDYSTWQGTIPTIAWEALREGVEDYCYLYTLTQWIKRARESQRPGAEAAAAAAETELQTLTEAVPWANPMGPMAFPSERLQQLRRHVAEQIVALQAILEGKGAKASAPRPQRLTLLVQAEEASPRLPVPSLAVPVVQAAPQIDGEARESAWQKAALVSDFRDIRSGVPADVPTTARIMADEHALYVAFDCVEPAISKIVPKETKHDGNVWLEDSIEVFVAGASREPYAHVIVTTGNVVLDERNQDMEAWQPKITTAVQKRADGWSVEMALPWEELAKAGVSRQSLMTLNLCRNRYVGGKSPHTAWAVTYNGFHTPARFGWAFMAEGPLALEQLELPTGWGRHELRVAVRNMSGQRVRAALRLGRHTREKELAPQQRWEAIFPLPLYRPGMRKLELEYGVASGLSHAVSLYVEVPEPLEVVFDGGIAKPNSVVPLTIRSCLPPAERPNYLIRLRVRDNASQKQEERFMGPAFRGAFRETLRLCGLAQLQVALVNALGREIWRSPQYPLLVLP